MECRYQLTTYGISPHLIPLHPMTNTLQLAHHLSWYLTCLLKTSGRSITLSKLPENTVIEVRPADVLYRAGGKTSNNEGNLQLRTLVKTLSLVYNSSTNEQKRQLVDGIIREIHKLHGRFLKEVPGAPASWTELSLDDKRTRIGQAFRNQRRQTDGAQGKEAPGTRISDTPGQNDIVLGSSAQKSRGRELLQRLIKDEAEDYDSLDRGMKVKVIDAIIQRIQSEGGRFLLPAPNNDGWLEVPNEEARGRVRKYFRNNRRGSRKANK